MKKLFHGKQAFLSLREAKKLANKLSKEEGCEIVISDCESSIPESIINQMTTDDIFSPKKVLLIKRLYSNKAKESLVEFLISSFKNLPKNIHYIFWEDQKISSITKYFKAFGKDVNEVEEVKKISFGKWATEELKRLDITAPREVLIQLISNVNYDPERFVNEMEKLDTLGVKELKLSDITENTTDSFEYDIWKLIGKINANDIGNALGIFQNLTSSLVDPNYIFAMLIRNLRLISQVKYLSLKDVQSKDICSRLGIAPFMLPELYGFAKTVDWEKIKYLYEKFTSLDYEIKRGNIDPQIGITLLITRIN